MRVKRVIADFLFHFVLAFLSATAVNFLWNFVVNGVGVIDWEIPICLAIALGIVVPLMNRLTRKFRLKSEGLFSFILLPLFF